MNRICAALLAMLCILQAGCVTWTSHAVPVYRLPLSERFSSPLDYAPIDLSLLRQDPPPEHLVGAGDVLSIYVYGVLPPAIDEAPIVQPPFNIGSEYYPPYGALRLPAMGIPLEVEHNGQLTLPIVGSLPVEGLTITAVRERILAAYQQAEVLQEGRERVTVSLLRPRVSRVLVIREDAGTDSPALINGAATPYTKRGRAEVLDLPAFENDVLHALTATGGLPGIDARNEVWVLRGGNTAIVQLEQLEQSVNNGQELPTLIEQLEARCPVVRIRLSVQPGQPLGFTPQDIVLNTGDVVFIPSREEFFYTGGLLPGRQIPLPRDRALDIVEAVAMAGGSVGGPSTIATPHNFHAGAGPGNAIIPPTRVLVLRSLPDGRKLPIRVDLARAMHDSKERLLIKPKDIILVHYTPSQATANAVLNFFNWSVAFPIGD